MNDHIHLLIRKSNDSTGQAAGTSSFHPTKARCVCWALWGKAVGLLHEVNEKCSTAGEGKMQIECTAGVFSVLTPLHWGEDFGEIYV